MRCHICNAALSPETIHFNRQHGDFDPCPTCLTVIGEVFSDEDVPEETEIEEEEDDDAV